MEPGELIADLRLYASKIMHEPAESAMREAADALEAALLRISEQNELLKRALPFVADYQSGQLSEKLVADIGAVLSPLGG